MNEGIANNEVDCSYSADEADEDDDNSILDDVVDAAVTIAVVDTVCDCISTLADAVGDIFSND